MIVLACETSTLLGSVAILENEKILASEESFRQGSHSDVVHPFVQSALNSAGKKLSDVDLFATGIGPGSFTGIRISLNAMKTFSYSFNKPIIGINSLNNLAQLASLSLREDLPIISMINAYKNMVYVATYRKNSHEGLDEIKKPSVIRVQNLVDYIEQKSVVCGDGYTAYEKFISDEVKQNIVRIAAPDEPHAKILGLLAYQNSTKSSVWNELTPLYLRASEAEENLMGIKYQPLK